MLGLPKMLRSPLRTGDVLRRRLSGQSGWDESRDGPTGAPWVALVEAGGLCGMRLWGTDGYISGGGVRTAGWGGSCCQP